MKNHIGESLLYTLINVVGSFLTILLAVLVSYVEGNGISMNDIFGKSEVLIICVPLCIGVLYSLHYNKKTKGAFNKSGALFWLTILNVIVAIWLYSKIPPVDVSNEPNRLITFTFIVFLWSVFVIFASKLSENSDLDLKSNRKENLGQLEGKFDNLNN